MKLIEIFQLHGSLVPKRCYVVSIAMCDVWSTASCGCRVIPTGGCTLIYYEQFNKEIKINLVLNCK